MDEVLADALGELLTRYNREKRTNFTKADLTGKWMWQVLPPGDQKCIEAYLQEDDFFEDLPVIPGSQEALLRLSEQYDIYIATAAMAFPNSFGPKFRWLRRHFPFLSPHHFVFCGDKGILRADYLIDDMPYNLDSFRGQGILFSSPHNAGKATPHRRVDTWKQVEEMFLPKVGA